jgi:hypothetical protein
MDTLAIAVTLQALLRTTPAVPAPTASAVGSLLEDVVDERNPPGTHKGKSLRSSPNHVEPGDIIRAKIQEILPHRSTWVT